MATETKKPTLEQRLEALEKRVDDLEIVDDLMEKAVAAYRRKGTIKDLVDSQDIPQKQKAKTFDKYMTAIKGKAPKSNPFA